MLRTRVEEKPGYYTNYWAIVEDGSGRVIANVFDHHEAVIISNMINERVKLNEEAQTRAKRGLHLLQDEA